MNKLPLDLESLLRAASSDALPDSAKLEQGLTNDLNRYTLAWGVAAFWDPAEATPKLWEVWKVWQDHLDRLKNARN